MHPPSSVRSPRGQMVVLFALVLSLIVFCVGLVIDGGVGLSQRRAAQNASDFASMAGARIVAEFIGGDSVNGTDANVQAAITRSVSANGGAPITFGAPNGPRYIDGTGTPGAYVGSGTLPSNAVGVTVTTNRSWRPFFLGIFGVTNWSTIAGATALGGFSQAGPTPGTLFPVGISSSFFSTYPKCDGPVSNTPRDPCYPQHLTPGNLNVPGGFGWLKFGCDGYGLGQDPPANAGGCSNSKPFLQGEIGPPSKTYGCCTKVGLPGSLDRIGSLPGNKASADCTYYIDNKVLITVPIWDTAGGNGSNAWYHIIGFAGFQLTGCSGGKDIEGVWREIFTQGPVSSTPGNPSVPQALGVQLVR
jgi:hypothetical protein